MGLGMWVVRVRWDMLGSLSELCREVLVLSLQVWEVVDLALEALSLVESLKLVPRMMVSLWEVSLLEACLKLALAMAEGPFLELLQAVVGPVGLANPREDLVYIPSMYFYPAPDHLAHHSIP